MNLKDIEVEVNRTQQEAMVAALKTFLSRPRTGISVSDLLFPRKTFYSRKHTEVEVTEDEMGYFIAGRGHHDIIGILTTTDEFTEVKVEWEGIKGHIDIYEDVPIEVKTTRLNRIATREELIRNNSHYFEQLGMYCAMTNHNVGRLLLFYLGVKNGDNKTLPKLVVYDVTYKDMGGIRKEMLERKKLLEDAFSADSAEKLPMCPKWMCQRCKYREFCLG